MCCNAKTVVKVVRKKAESRPFQPTRVLPLQVGKSVARPATTDVDKNRSGGTY